MVDVLGATSTIEEVLAGVNLHGKQILVTGVSAGIGVETARSLAAHGAHVVGAARNLAKAKTAIAQVLKGGTFNLGSFELIELDLADLKSVRRCANALLAKGEPFFSFFNQRAAEGLSLQLGNSLEPTPRTLSAAGLRFCLRAQLGRANRNPSTCALESN